ncbi:hypothetical protein ACFLT1_03145 [Bacteroidota bacterium]
MNKTAIQISTLILIGIALFSNACVNHNELELYAEPECDTINITWENTIADILERNCVVCHGAQTSYNDVRHDSYESELIVVKDGRLRGVVNYLPGYPKMPFQQPQLPECELKQINIWLDNGAPEK